eukprot:scaffold1642_cov252-Pinguiococcus_pyrenoidosus.AAC.4
MALGTRSGTSKTARRRGPSSAQPLRDHRELLAFSVGRCCRLWDSQASDQAPRCEGGDRSCASLGGTWRLQRRLRLPVAPASFVRGQLLAAVVGTPCTVAPPAAAAASADSLSPSPQLERLRAAGARAPPTTSAPLSLSAFVLDSPQSALQGFGAAAPPTHA